MDKYTKNCLSTILYAEPSGSVGWALISCQSSPVMQSMQFQDYYVYIVLLKYSVDPKQLATLKRVCILKRVTCTVSLFIGYNTYNFLNIPN